MIEIVLFIFIKIKNMLQCLAIYTKFRVNEKFGIN